jgi:GDP-mannose transporter
MADDKKRDDYTIDLSDQKASDRFSPPPPRSMPSPSAGASQGAFSPKNQGLIAILSYCASSILMTTTNKYVLSGLDYNLNFLLLAVQVHIITF